MRKILWLAFLAMTVATVPIPSDAATSRAQALGAHPRVWLDQPTLAFLRAKVSSNDPTWRRLHRRCNSFLDGKVSWPDGNDYPSGGSIGEGYQGDGYFSPLLELGLCYQATRNVDATGAAAYAKKGATVLKKMSAPPGTTHAQDPLRDSGYGIRFFGLGMAIGYDWFYDALSPTLRSRVVDAINHWIDRYEHKGFENDFPVGNYFAGYYAAKGIGAIATEGDNDVDQWDDFLTRVQGQMVQPYYAANLSGGGWPEGWNYGPVANANMSWVALAIKTATGSNPTTDPSAPFTFPVTAPLTLQYSTWPSLESLEDSGFVYDSDNPTATPRWLFTLDAGLLERLDGTGAAEFHNFASAVRAVAPVTDQELQRWIDFLFWDSSGAGDFTTSPLSHEARGLDNAYVRSSWNTDAVWGMFKSGPYVACPCSGEEFYDKGSLTIVDGERPFLVNAWGALLRNTPGTGDGSQYFNPLYDDLYGDAAHREIFNIFYVDEPTPEGQGEYLRQDGATTALSDFDEGGDYVFMRGTNLADQYPQYRDNNPKTITSWTRDVIYVRPDLFIVDDVTEITDVGIDQWMAFHFPARPRAITGSSSPRFDVGSDNGYLGSVETIFPKQAVDTIENVFDSGKVFRLEIRPGQPATKQHWLTVFDAGSDPGTAVDATPMSVSDGNVTSGSASGTALEGNDRDVVYLKVATLSSSGLTYHSATTDALNVLTGLDPDGSYSIVVSTGPGTTTVSLTSGGSLHPSDAGVLTFTT
jgi:hypothetical protein